MRFPVLIPYSNYIFMGISFLFLLLFNYIRNDVYRFNKFKVFLLSLFTMVFGIFGTIVLANIEHPEDFFSFSTSLYGALLFLPFFMLLAKLIYRKDKYFDILNYIAPTILVVIAVMRINCTLAGCCYGIQCDFGITYDGVTRFPVQMMEAVLDLIAFAFLYFNERKRWIKANNYWLLLTIYPIIRLLCEFFRDDQKVFLNLSTGQIISILLLFIVLFSSLVSFFIKKRTIKKK